MAEFKLHVLNGRCLNNIYPPLQRFKKRLMYGKETEIIKPVKSICSLQIRKQE
jgi:hypothetical protein